MPEYLDCFIQGLCLLQSDIQNADRQGYNNLAIITSLTKKLLTAAVDSTDSL